MNRYFPSSSSQIKQKASACAFCRAHHLQLKRGESEKAKEPTTDFARIDAVLSRSACKTLVQFEVFAEMSRLKGVLAIAVAYHVHLDLVQHSNLETYSRVKK